MIQGYLAYERIQGFLGHQPLCDCRERGLPYAEAQRLGMLETLEFNNCLLVAGSLP